MRAAIQHLKKDAVLATLLKQTGAYRIEYRDPVFETLVRSIVYQQLSGKVASVIFGRLLEKVKGKLTPRSILKLTVEQMRALGLSGQKTEYIRELARHTKEGSVVFESLTEMSDEEVIEHLTQVKGIGVWTAQMFLMFALQRHDVLPVADLGIRTAMKRAWDLPELPKPAEMEKLAEGWRPYRSVACWYLWRSLDGPAAL